MTNIFRGGRRVEPFHGVRWADIAAAREKLWEKYTDDTAMTRIGDVVASKPRPSWGDDPAGSDLWRYGFRRAGWWVKPQLDSVVFRPHLTAYKDMSREEGGRYEYDYTRGTFILLWGSSYGVPCKRSLIEWVGEEHFRTMLLREMISNPRVIIEEK